jgi:periplasmic copper chaperone A
MTPRTLKSVVLTALLVTSPLALAGKAADTVTVSDPYVRLVPAAAGVTGAYMMLKNTDTNDHALVKAASGAAKNVELHTVIMAGGKMEMRPVPKMDVKAGGETQLKPGSFHIMLIGLKAPLKEGADVALTLTFEDGSTKNVVAPVKKIATTMPMAHGDMKH